ncbi:MAG: ABC transporter permease [Pirellulales bacterium]
MFLRLVVRDRVWPGGSRRRAVGRMVAAVIALPIASPVAIGILSGVLTVWSRLPSFIITLAMMNIANGLARYLTRSEALEVPHLLKTIGNGGIDLTPRIMVPYSAMLALVVLVVGHIVLVHTRFGRYVYMVGGNREAARLAGVRTGLVVAVCLSISALTASVGGLVEAGRLNAATLDQNADLLLEAVACVVLGGTSLFGGEGSMSRTAIGVLTFVVLKVGLNQVGWVNDFARQLLMGGVLMTALVVNGLLAKRGK